MEIGLVKWKDSKIGVLKISRPEVIKEYNEFIGGVDLCDKRRLGCPTGVTSLHRWWVQFFFCLILQCRMH